jgi:hypothetical protein
MALAVWRQHDAGLSREQSRNIRSAGFCGQFRGGSIVFSVARWGMFRDDVTHTAGLDGPSWGMCLMHLNLMQIRQTHADCQALL